MNNMVNSMQFDFNIMAINKYINTIIIKVNFMDNFKDNYIKIIKIFIILKDAN